MTLKQPFKLNDIQNRPLVVFCAMLIGIIIYLVNQGNTNTDECRNDRIVLQAQKDSMSREQIILYRTIAFQREQLGNADSILRSKTQKEVEDILKKKDEKSKN